MPWKRFVIAGDSHGDMCDRSAVSAFLKFRNQYDPHLTIHLGDAFDFRAWRTKASAEDKADSMQADYDAGIGLLADMGANVWVLGNHDWRLWKTAQDARGPMQDYAARIVQDTEDTCRKLGCRIVPYGVRDGVFELGDVRSGGYRVIHGYRAGLHATSAEVRAYGRVIHGHIHCVTSIVAATYDDCEGHSIGCLCQLDMDYAKSNETGLRQEHAWAYGVYDTRSGAVLLQIARKVAGKWMTPTI